MLVTVLIILNIPIYLLIGWVVFDTKDKAAGTFFDTVVAILKIILIPGIVRVLLGMDDEDALGILPIGLYLFTCVALIFGEHYLITKWFFAGN